MNEPDLWKIGHQLNTMADQADNGQYGGRLFDVDNGLTCVVRYANSPPINLDNIGCIDENFSMNFTIDAQLAMGEKHGITIMAPVSATGAPTTCEGY